MNELATQILESLAGIFTVDRVLSILFILFIAWFAKRVLVSFLEKIIRRSIRGQKFKTEKDEIQREDTIISLVHTGASFTIWLIAGLMILGTFEVNLGPLLAGAGVVGVALGFGAQSIVKDFLAGFFIIAENQYRVGDVVQVNRDVAGVVEKISLRQTTLRDLEGRAHYIPNGNIELASNLTIDYAQVDLNIGVGYDTDINKLEQIIEQVGKEIAADPEFSSMVLEPAKMLRVDAFADSSITVKIVCKTAPMMQWDIKGQLLRRLKVQFEKEGIDIPFPQRVLHEASPKSHRPSSRK